MVTCVVCGKGIQVSLSHKVYLQPSFNELLRLVLHDGAKRADDDSYAVVSILLSSSSPQTVKDLGKRSVA